MNFIDRRTELQKDIDFLCAVARQHHAALCKDDETFGIVATRSALDRVQRLNRLGLVDWDFRDGRVTEFGLFVASSLFGKDPRTWTNDLTGCQSHNYRDNRKMKRRYLALLRHASR